MAAKSSAGGASHEDSEFLHKLASSRAADAALEGRGLELDAELIARIAVENGKDKPDEMVLAHLYFARGMVNWYMERPGLAAEAFGEAASKTTKINKRRAVANQLLSLDQAGTTPTKEQAGDLSTEGKTLEERYLIGLLHLALGETEAAIETWYALLRLPVKAPAPPTRPTPGIVGTEPATEHKNETETRGAAAEALVSALVEQKRVEEARLVWKTYVAGPEEAK